MPCPAGLGKRKSRVSSNGCLLQKVEKWLPECPQVCGSHAELLKKVLTERHPAERQFSYKSDQSCKAKVLPKLARLRDRAKTTLHERKDVKTLWIIYS